MIIYEVSYNKSIRNDIYNYCKVNDLSISHRINMGNCDYYNLSGEVINIEKLINYTKQLKLKNTNLNKWYKFLK